MRNKPDYSLRCFGSDQTRTMMYPCSKKPMNPGNMNHSIRVPHAHEELAVVTKHNSSLETACNPKVVGGIDGALSVPGMKKTNYLGLGHLKEQMFVQLLIS